MSFSNKAGSPKNYDKYTYALKRKSEKETSPMAAKSSSATLLPVDPHTGLVPLTMNRDGFAVSEDGSLMSRLVSPPLRTSTAVTGTAATNNANSNKKKSGGPAIDGWQRLVDASAGDLSEEELAMLQWDTVQGLLTHYNVVNPVDIARAQLVWKSKQQSILDSASDAGTGTDAPDLGLSPASQPRLRTQPISQISYGRPGSPRIGKGPRYVPQHQKPLTWKDSKGVSPKVDCGPTKKSGLNSSTFSNGSSQMMALSSQK